MNPVNDTIVLVHGLAANRLVMWPLGHRLRAAGFNVHAWHYASLFQPIEKHAGRLYAFLTHDLAGENCVHIVAHSMGAIVARAALNRGLVPNLGRVVLLAPPNAGSPVARWASTVFGRVLPPTRELSTDSGSYVNQLAVNEAMEVGIIAARYDLLVPVGCTHLKGERAHQILPALHGSLLFSREVVKKIARFLRTGDA